MSNQIPNAPKSYELLLSHNLLLKATTHVTPACCLDFDEKRSHQQNNTQSTSQSLCVCDFCVAQFFENLNNVSSFRAFRFWRSIRVRVFGP
jgi:hypothetical protein